MLGKILVKAIFEVTTDIIIVGVEWIILCGYEILSTIPEDVILEGMVN